MKKNLYGALALSLLAVGCSQEELAPKANQIETSEQNLESVVGHDLVGPISISIADGATRATGGSWDKGDKLGLAWFNIESSGITALQNPATYTAAGTTIGSATNDIYGNHLFSVAESGAFETQTNVYQGAHFVYWPFARATKVEQKTVSLNGKEYEGDASYDLDNVAFRMSPVDFISAADVNADMKLAKRFQLEPVAAAIGLKASPSAQFKGNETLKNLKVVSYQVASAAGVTFEPTFSIVTANLPKATYQAAPNADKLDAAANKAAMEAYAQGISETGVAMISRNVKAGAITLANDMVLPLYTLPVTPATVTPDNFTVTINVKTASGLDGHFTIANPTNETNNPSKNQVAVNKLTNAVKTNAALTKITRNSADEYTYLALDVDLAKANFTLDANISNKTEWDDAVAIYNALGGDATFTVDGNVVFDGEIPTLANGKITVAQGAGGKLTIKGNVELPAAAKLNADAAVIEVVNGATLTLADGLKLKSAGITNNGVIKLGDRSQVGNATSDGQTPPTYTVQGVDNTNGRIEVVYGSYAYVTAGKEGVVAYEVPEKYQTYQINNLISNSNSNGLASVNTLVVKSGVTLNLTGVDGGVDDPYNSTGAAGLNSLSSIDIELAGGSLIKGTGNTNTTVHNVKVVEATSNVVDEIIIAGNLTTSKGTEATVKTSTLQNDLTNKGTLKLKDVTFNLASVLSNSDSGTLEIDATKTGNPATATFRTTAASLTNMGYVNVKGGVLTLTITNITNTADATIEADNIQQVKFSSLNNNGTLIRVTQ